MTDTTDKLPTFGALHELATDIGARLSAAGETVCVSESSSGGLVSAALLSVSGASAFYIGGTVVYTNASRRALLGMRRVDVSGIAPMTPKMAAVFASKTRATLGTDWAIAELGATGPKGTPYGHEAGTAAIAVSGLLERSMLLNTGVNDRQANMWSFAAAALELLGDALDEKSAPWRST